MADPIPPYILPEIKGSALTNLEFSNDLRQIRVAYNAFLASYVPAPSILPTANGGTGANLTLVGNRVIISSGAVMAENAAILANRAIVSNANGLPTHSNTTAAQINFSSDVTGFIQAQIDSKYNNPAGTTAQYIRGDGSIANFPTGLPPGGPAGGDLTGTYPSPLIGANKVTYAKFQQVAAQRLLGNPTGVAANASEISLGSGLSFSGSQLQVNGALSQWVTTGSDIYYNTGNVGIGTATPLARLDLDGIWRYNAGSVNHIGTFPAAEVKYQLQNDSATGFTSLYVFNDSSSGLSINQYGTTYVQSGQLDIPDTTNISTSNINWSLQTPYEFKVWTGTGGALVENFRIGQTYTQSLNRVNLNRGMIITPKSTAVTIYPYSVSIDDAIVTTSTTGGNMVLPDTTTLVTGHMVTFQSIAGVTFNIVPYDTGTENIMGAASYAVAANQSVTLIKYPLNWRIISSFGGTTFTLANGSGTTAAGSAVNLGGTLTADATLSSNTFNFNIAHSTSSRNTRFAAAGNFQIWNGATSGQTVVEYDPAGYVSLPSFRINPAGSTWSAGAPLHVRGSSTGANMAFLVQNSTPNTLFGLSENGIATMGFRVDFNSAFGGGNLIQPVRALEFDTTLTPTSTYVYRFKQTNAYSTLADWSHMLLEGNWAIASGSNTAAFVDIHPTFVQSGSHSGMLRGLYIRPVATLIGEFRAIESTTGNLVMAAQTLTGSQAFTFMNMTQTWNTSGTPTLFSIALTDTASNAASMLANWTVGGTTMFSVSKSGGLKSGTPGGSGAGVWKLGTKIAGSFTPDATNAIELSVDGVLYKVGLVT